MIQIGIVLFYILFIAVNGVMITKCKTGNCRSNHEEYITAMQRIIDKITLTQAKKVLLNQKMTYFDIINYCKKAGVNY